MRTWPLLFLCAAGILLAQQSSRRQSYTFDVNGNRVGARSVSVAKGAHGSLTTERVSSVSGRSVPRERVAEKVLEDGPRGRVIERTIQRYDQDGQPTESERVRIEERPGRNGRTTTTTMRSFADINGRFRMAERLRTEAVPRGKTTEFTTTVERPTVNGSMEVVERRTATETEREDGTSRDETIYRKAQGGGFTAAARETTETVRKDGRETTTQTRFNKVNFRGKMEFARQTVTDTEWHADGSQEIVISDYGAAPPGRMISSGPRRAHLREQQIIDRQLRSDGSVMERTGVRRVTLSDPDTLGAYQKVSEVICTGQCLDRKPKTGKDAGAGAKQTSNDK